MGEVALEWDQEEHARTPERAPQDALEVRLLKVGETEYLGFYRGQLLASYDRKDKYTRNFVIVQLFITHKVSQEILSRLFNLTIPHISSLVGRYRRSGSAGLEDRSTRRLRNNYRLKGKVEEYIVELLTEAEPPTYECVAKLVKKRYRKTLSAGTIGNWWRANKKRLEEQRAPQQGDLALATEASETPDKQSEQSPSEKTEETASEAADQGNHGQWQPNVVAGSFILYALLAKSQFLKPFIEGIKGAWNKGKDRVDRVMLTLYFIHALRLKSIEQTKHIIAAHFGPLVLGPFHRQQSLRDAIDKITGHKHFDQTLTQHYRQLSEQTEIGDEIYYTDGHFSRYYGKYKVPKGYDPRRKQPARGRNTIYLHNSLGHNVLSFESPTNTSLNVDIETLIEKMKEVYGRVKSKTLFFDRGGFSAQCFKRIKQEDMYFATYLKHRKKASEVEIELLTEVEIEINGQRIKNRIYEKEKNTKHYGVVRTIIFIGRQAKQIPVITTNPNLSAAEIVARIQKRWVEENGFKYMREHFNMDLLTTYKTEEAPDKIMARPNPKRKAINQEISTKKQALKELREHYSNRIDEVKEKQTLTIADFERREQKLRFEIKNLEMEIGLLALKKKYIPAKVKSNLKDESVITLQKRRLFINLVKCMNYNSEKWLQELFCQYHPKQDETLSLIRRVLTQPGRLRQRGRVLEVEIERLDSQVQANSLDKVIDKLRQYNYLTLPDGRRLEISQAA